MTNFISVTHRKMLQNTKSTTYYHKHRVYHDLPGQQQRLPTSSFHFLLHDPIRLNQLHHTFSLTKSHFCTVLNLMSVTADAAKLP